MFQILCRYQYYGPKGIEWTKWYVYFDNFSTKKDAEEKLDKMPKDDKKSKFKYEYKVVEKGGL